MKIFLLLSLLTFSVSLESRIIFPLTNHIDSILIHYVDFELMTPVDIGCDDFENFFSYKKVMIRDSLHLSDFGNILLENGTDTTHSIDVRCKICLFTPQGVKLVCVGKHSKMLDGHFYNTDSLFTDKLEALISKGEEVKNDTIINTIPVLLMNRDMFYKRIEHSCLPIMKNEHLDSLKIFVDFNIDRQGNAVDITVKGKGGEVISPVLQSEIIRLFQDDFKWSSSQLRSFKIRRIIPITLFSN